MTTPLPCVTVHEKLDRILERLETISETQDEQQRQIELIRDRLESMDTFSDLTIEDFDDDIIRGDW